ncbi:hypothetical protein ACFOEE_03105 [Pseudoalteromonas fenneropenaei]|uniref:Iron transporter n=1 Tax=Pseudoalteromonas fenneropenaei TaxID=1737459 RepID=A0ABV7CFX7_9GAMM
MLLNTVILCINQCLPIALLWVLMLQCVRNSKLPLLHALSAIGIGVIGCIAYLQAAGVISQWFDYRGFEVSQIFLLVLLYANLLLITLKPRIIWQQTALALSVITYLSHFLTYLNSFMSADALQSLLVGTILGLGICFSFSTLLYFLLASTQSTRSTYWLMLLFALHAASKISVASDLSTQIDLLASTPSVVDLRWFLDEHSVFGRVFKVLLGYEASPSWLNLTTYIGGAGAFYLVWLARGRKREVAI